MEDLKALIVQYLEEQKLMQLCTVGESGDPWVCSVWQAADEDMNIYFFSSITRRHSQEIEKDSRIAGALALPHQPTDPHARGLQFEGTVQRLESEEERQTARKVYEGRIFNAEQINSLINDSEKPHEFYKITPKKFVLFDNKNFPDESRQEYVV